MLQSSLAMLDFVAHQADVSASGKQAEQIKRLVGAAMAPICEIAVMLYQEHLEAVPPEMRPPDVHADEELREAVRRWASGFKRLED